MIEPLERVSAVEALVRALRARILDGDLPAGARLVERDLTARFVVARHTLRAALRTLAAEGLVVIEANRGARVASLSEAGLTELFELRTALEVEAARLALERHDGRLPQPVHDAVAELEAVCAGTPPWSDVATAHDAVHRAIVVAAGAPRIASAHGALAAELSLFVVQLRPTWSFARMAGHHRALLTALERDGADALRPHLADGLRSVIAGAPQGSVV